MPFAGSANTGVASSVDGATGSFAAASSYDDVCDVHGVVMSGTIVAH